MNSQRFLNLPRLECGSAFCMRPSVFYCMSASTGDRGMHGGVGRLAASVPSFPLVR